FRSISKAKRDFANSYRIRKTLGWAYILAHEGRGFTPNSINQALYDAEYGRRAFGIVKEQALKLGSLKPEEGKQLA
ncbi:MAG: hypothetical protein LBC69_00550, partial [Eubacteriaceae bacterium]|nr:hypothetical protein [Eubacteriaceae bacterium]